MIFNGRIPESAAATKTFDALRIEGRVLATPSRTIPIANIASVSVGTHVRQKPTLLYWGLAALFLVMTFGSMRPDLSFGPLSPTGATVLLGFITLAFAVLALKPQDKTPYLLISSNDGVLSRFTAPDSAILDEVRGILTEKINRVRYRFRERADREPCGRQKPAAAARSERRGPCASCRRRAQ